MKYSVVVKENGETVSETPDCTEKEAKKLAKAEATKNKKAQIYVTFYRRSDGQHGYLNSDGNHAITGTAW